MPFAGIGLHLAIAIYFAAHAMKTGQDRYWLWILIGMPGIGSLAYALLVWLPDFRRSHGGAQLVRGAQRFFDPSRELLERRGGHWHRAVA